MIQRIQSIYLLLSALVSGVLVFLISFWITENQETINVLGLINDERFLIKSIGIGFLISSALSFLSIFLFKNRQNQFVLGRINILINFYLLGVLLIESLNLPGETTVSVKGIGVFLPIIVVVFLAMANKAIKKDENLVKSVDRLR
ncbi:DUF4293 domain-containing protein [Flavicella sp.]|uniref:DUF4293 domain-containing protein n=1 Tax=Flavicella sp. TaxID=2957742 RepID=UPI00301A9093